MSVLEVRRDRHNYSQSSRVPSVGVALVRDRRNAVRGVGRAASASGSARHIAELDYDQRCMLLQKIFERCSYKGLRDTPWGQGTPFSAGIENGMEANASARFTTSTLQDIPDAVNVNETNYTNPVSYNPLYQAQGSTTMQYAVFSPIRLYLAYQKLLQAERLGDVEGQKLAKAEMVTKLFSTAGGLSYVVARPLSIIASLTHVAASSFTQPTQLGSAAFAAPLVGIWCFCIAGAISSVKSGWNIYKGLKLQSELAQIKDESDKMAHLTHLIKPTAEELAEIAQAKEEDLIKDAMQQGAEELFSLIKEQSKEPGSEVPKLSIKECRDLLTTQLTSSDPHAEASLRSQKIELGRAVRLANLKMKKEGQLARVIGDEAVQMLKTQKTSKEVLDQIELSVSGQRTINLMNIAANVANTISVAITIILLVSITGGFGFLALSYIGAIASIVYGATGLMLDAYACKKGLETVTKPGPWDKGLLTVGVIANWISFIVGISLMFTLGPVVYGALAIGIALFLYLNIIHYYTWSKTRRKVEENKKLGMDEFVKELASVPEMTKGKVADLFKKLSLEEQTAFRDELLRFSGKKDSYSHEEVIHAARYKARLHASLTAVANSFLKQERQLATG